ncbi:acyltransferase domain-containing protein [Kribbella antibiotica]|uniref:[acyl-carrier-protein] S-malonyltransferase n=1 Tax=Kribbella antibiotica TaxID=190195 RepID=A0A4R4ZRQ6_9ACTN|nr:acyltransferase domain-containing protein [Kribbella antibiotica]TDD61673.1 acyltransferase domain-containing protein [Kribbella antibiotica]
MNRSDGRPVFVFPGQGGYSPGVFALSKDSCASILPTLARVDAAAGASTVTELLTSRAAPALADLMVDDPAALHLAIFAAGVAAAELWVDEFGVHPGLLMGHSFGEFAALTVAGALTLETGVALVTARDAALLAGWRDRGELGGMVALMAGPDRVGKLAAAVDRDLAVAVVNGVEQVVVSGRAAALDRLTGVAAVLDISTTRLQVPYPFHNRVLADAAERFAVSVAAAEIRTPRHLVYSPLLGGYVETADDAREVLTRHLVHRIDFVAALLAVRGDGHTAFVECGARSVCTGLIEATLVGVNAVAPLRRRVGADDLRNELQRLDGRPSTAEPSSAGTTAGFEEPVAAADAAPMPMPMPTTPTPAVQTIESDGAALSVDELVPALRALYADAVGYPVDVFEPGIELEAELGIDSLRQTAILEKVREIYGLPEIEKLRITDYVTIEAVAQLVVELVDGQLVTAG